MYDLTDSLKDTLIFFFCLEPVPVPGPTQLPSPFGSVWDRLHRGLGLY